jgi:hypothetical protein
MERFILSSLSVMLIYAMNSPAVRAETPTMNLSASHLIVEVKPFNLVQLGYQGYFKTQGIPSNGAFISAIHSGKVNANALIETAIAAGRLAPETLNNPSYVNAVENQLLSLNQD